MTFSAEDIAGHPNVRSPPLFPLLASPSHSHYDHSTPRSRPLLQLLGLTTHATTQISLDTPSLILIALLSGGDYSPGIPGCGISVSASLAQCGFGRSLVEKVQSLSLSISLGLQTNSNGGTSGSRTAKTKTKTSKTRVTLGTSEKEELLTWLETWREELCTELRTNSRGFLKKRMPTLASRIEREKWVPDLQVLMAYVCPVTSEERAVAKALLSHSSSFSSLSSSSSQTSSVVETAKREIAQDLRNQYIWAHDPDIGAIARVCEDRFEWGVREVILKRFRSWLWVGVVCRMLRRAMIDSDMDSGGGEGELSSMSLYIDITN